MTDGSQPRRGKGMKKTGHCDGSVRIAHDDRPPGRRGVRAIGRPGWLWNVDAPHGLVPPVGPNL